MSFKIFAKFDHLHLGMSLKGMLSGFNIDLLKAYNLQP